MVNSNRINDAASLRRAINELESENTVQLINLKLKVKELQDNLFLKTDFSKYSFDQGQKIEKEIVKLIVRKVLKPKSIVGGTFSTLVSTFVVQTYGKKITKTLKKLLKNFIS
jgi:hypothetical protein